MDPQRLLTMKGHRTMARAQQGRAHTEAGGRCSGARARTHLDDSISIICGRTPLTCTCASTVRAQAMPQAAITCAGTGQGHTTARQLRGARRLQMRARTRLIPICIELNEHRHERPCERCT